MPVTVVSTPGASNANSLASVAEGDAFFADRLYGTAWNAAVALPDADARARAVITGTDILMRLRYVGWQTTTTQALMFPRDGVYDALERWVPNDTVPVGMKRALFLLAEALLKSPTANPLNPGAVEGIAALSIGQGAVSLTFRDGESKPTGFDQYPDVLRELAPFLYAAIDEQAHLVRS